ncbi:MAG: hypothetical protein Q9213_008132 [Squamulea squamosa]
MDVVKPTGLSHREMANSEGSQPQASRLVEASQPLQSSECRHERGSKSPVATTHDPVVALALQTPIKRPGESLDDDKSRFQDLEFPSGPIARKRLRMGDAEGVNLFGMTFQAAQTSEAEDVLAADYNDGNVLERVITSHLQVQRLCDSQILGEMIATGQLQTAEYGISSAQPVGKAEEATIGQLKEEETEYIGTKARVLEVNEETEDVESPSAQPDTATDGASGRCSIM